MSSNKTNTSVDDVKSWWDDKKEARVASWWDDKKNARVASWWDDKKKARVASWWDAKNQRVASWWDTKNQRVASAWWDTKNIRVSSHWWDNDKAQKKVQKKARVASPWWDTKKSQKKARVASWWDTKNVKDWDWDTKAKSAKVAKNYGYKGECGTKVTVPKGHTFTCLDQDDNRRVNCLVQSAIQYRCCTDEDGCREADDFTYWRF